MSNTVTTVTTAAVQAPPPEPVDPRELVVFDNKVYHKFDDPLFGGYIPVPVTKFTAPPGLRWNGEPISFELWMSIVAFMLWGFKEKKSEVHVTLFYNLETGVWDAWAFPQNLGGMTVRTLEGPEYNKQRAMYPYPWVQMGSIHHHCSSGAFASGVDQADEIDRDGLHITLGQLDKAKLDIHLRATYKKSTEVTYLPWWLEMPDWIANAPEGMRWNMMMEFALTPSYHVPPTFPEIWKTNCTTQPTYPNGNYQGYLGTVGGGTSSAKGVGRDFFQGTEQEQKDPTERQGGRDGVQTGTRGNPLTEEESRIVDELYNIAIDFGLSIEDWVLARKLTQKELKREYGKAYEYMDTFVREMDKEIRSKLKIAPIEAALLLYRDGFIPLSAL